MMGSLARNACAVSFCAKSSNTCAVWPAPARKTEDVCAAWDARRFDQKSPVDAVGFQKRPIRGAEAPRLLI
jgi:hypothetical protein